MPAYVPSLGTCLHSAVYLGTGPANGRTVLCTVLYPTSRATIINTPIHRCLTAHCVSLSKAEEQKKIAQDQESWARFRSDRSSRRTLFCGHEPRYVELGKSWDVRTCVCMYLHPERQDPSRKTRTITPRTTQTMTKHNLQNSTKAKPPSPNPRKIFFPSRSRLARARATHVPIQGSARIPGTWTPPPPPPII